MPIGTSVYKVGREQEAPQKRKRAIKDEVHWKV